jgi:hypothetical protein
MSLRRRGERDARELGRALTRPLKSAARSYAPDLYGPIAPLLDAQPVLHEGKVRIMAERCSTCLFSPGLPKGVVRPGGVRWMLERVRERDSFVNCHKTLATGQPGAVCRGSDNAHEGMLMRMARAEGVVVEVTEAEVLAEGERYATGRPKPDRVRVKGLSAVRRVST